MVALLVPLTRIVRMIKFVRTDVVRLLTSVLIAGLKMMVIIVQRVVSEIKI